MEDDARRSTGPHRTPITRSRGPGGHHVDHHVPPRRADPARRVTPHNNVNDTVNDIANDAVITLTHCFVVDRSGIAFVRIDSITLRAHRLDGDRDPVALLTRDRGISARSANPADCTNDADDPHAVGWFDHRDET